MAARDGITDLARQVSSRARDVAYVAVGLGVLGVQRAQVQRRELARQLHGDLGGDGQLDDLRAAASTGVRQLDGLVEAGVRVVESALQPVEEQLPPAAREAVEMARAGARELREQIRRLFAA